MVTPCGHSFSTSSITAWLRQQGSATKKCPVCKSTINESLIPNWALRNAVDRYPPYSQDRSGCLCAMFGVTGFSDHTVPENLYVVVGRYNQKYGKRRASSSADDAPPDQQVHIDLADYPVKPSGTLALAGIALPPQGVSLLTFLAVMVCTAPPVGLHSSASSASSAPSFHAEDDRPAQPTFSQATAATSSSPSPAYAPAAAPAAQDEGSDCECCLERPVGKRGCCVWECTDCGVCKMADDCSGPGCLLVFPTTTVTCQGSFGKWSNWYSRTICGTAPLRSLFFLFSRTEVSPSSTCRVDLSDLCGTRAVAPVCGHGHPLRVLDAVELTRAAGHAVLPGDALLLPVCQPRRRQGVRQLRLPGRPDLPIMS